MDGYEALHVMSDKLDQEVSQFSDLSPQKEDILRWFQSSDESDGVWVLTRLAQTSTHLFQDILSNTPRSKAPDISPQGIKTQVVERKQPRKQEAAFVGDPIVQFASEVFYAREGVDSDMVLDVIRIGNCEGTTEVFYETEDETAMHGRAYIATSGKVVFAPGETRQYISVQIVNNNLWDTTTVFRCTLKPEGLKGAVLGLYLYTARVRILDNDSFPTPEFSNLTTQAKIAECSKFSLLVGYCQVVVNIPRVWMGTIKWLLVELTHILWTLLKLFMTVYILDYIVDTSRPESELFFVHCRRGSLAICALVHVLANAVLHMLDYARVAFPVSGPTRRFVQRALLRRFLNYAPIVREQLRPGDVQLAVQNDAVSLVTSGYMNILKSIGIFSELIFMIAFKAAAAPILGKECDWRGLICFTTMPILLTIYLLARERSTSMVLKRKHEMQSQLVSQLSVSIVNVHLLIHYDLRLFCETKFAEGQIAYSKASRAANQITINNTYFCQWCKSFLIAIWMLYGGLKVIQGESTLGLFVTSLRIIEVLGSALVDLYNIAVDMMKVFPALENVTFLLNQKTDVPQRHALKRAARALTLELRVSEPNRGTDVPAIDLVPIVFKFDKPFKFDMKEFGALNFKGRVEIQQGQMVAVVGPIGCGKATLLRIIAGVTLPPESMASSSVFVPSHLRLTNVAEEPLFFAGTLYENLVFGMDKHHPGTEHERVKSICDRLTKNHIISDHLDDYAMEQTWHDVYSGVQSKLLSIARALIHNREVICIHTPFEKMTKDDADHVMRILHDHIHCKGIELDGNIAHRRPRTVVVSSPDIRKVQGAHAAIHISPLEGLKLLPA